MERIGVAEYRMRSVRPIPQGVTYVVAPWGVVGVGRGGDTFQNVNQSGYTTPGRVAVICEAPDRGSRRPPIIRVNSRSFAVKKIPPPARPFNERPWHGNR
jgi:hypothetical protein